MTKRTTMNQNFLLRTLGIALLSLVGLNQAKAQQTYFLNVDSIIGIPDTIYDGSTVTFSMVFSNVSNLGFQGSVDTWIQVQGTADSIQADSTTWDNAFIQAQSQTMVSVTHLFTSDGNNLSIGDNVVVVWPRISSGPVFPPQEVINKGTASFFLAEPLGINPVNDSKKETLRLFPNPSSSLIELRLPTNETLQSVQITDVTGRIVLEAQDASVLVSTALLPIGFYTVHATTSAGSKYCSRLLVQR